MGRTGGWRRARFALFGLILVLAWSGLPALLSEYSARAADGAVVKVPVIGYHNIDYSGSAYAVTPEMLDAMCAWLVQNGYTTITVNELYAAATGVGILPPNPVMLTDDDGWVSAVTFADTLDRYGLVGNFFINNYSPLTADQILRLTWTGPVQSHTAFHQWMSKMDYQGQLNEITSNQAYITGITGLPVRFLAWPFGDSNDSAVQAARDAGIVAAFSLSGGPAYVGSLDLYHIPRTLMTPSDTLDTFIAVVTRW
ncbi:MAG: polysaccharide deacetylase family protein [Thermomicrobiales bacterium]|nr:polysaccharide deacetylase family protein [Thermomicrobiales bacterium]